MGWSLIAICKDLAHLDGLVGTMMLKQTQGSTQKNGENANPPSLPFVGPSWWLRSFRILAPQQIHVRFVNNKKTPGPKKSDSGGLPRFLPRHCEKGHGHVFGTMKQLHLHGPNLHRRCPGHTDVPSSVIMATFPKVWFGGWIHAEFTLFLNCSRLSKPFSWYKKYRKFSQRMCIICEHLQISCNTHCASTC